MPISNEEVRNYQIESIISSDKEELNKLSDTELSVIASILKYRKKNTDIRLFVIRDLLYSAHYLIMQEEEKISNKGTIPKKEKKQIIKGKPDLKIVK